MSANNKKSFLVDGAGLGFRSEFIDDMNEATPEQVGFYEVAPENWMFTGGSRGKNLRRFTEQHPFVCHGLSLSIGSPSPLDEDFLHDVKKFLDTHNIRIYTEHLSFCSDDSHLYDLMPIPFTEEAVHYVADRIKRTQDILNRQIGMENVSTYAKLGGELSEVEFLNAVISEADCGLHLDINNIFVNSINHKFDAYEYLSQIPADRIMYAHIAGHYKEAEDLRVDTHGEDVIPEVWDLLDAAYEQYGVFPTLLERDFNIPPLAELLGEVDQIAAYQKKWQNKHNENVA